MRKISLLLIICMISMTLSSCYDANEVDNLLHVTIIGVDRGIADKWRLTVMFPTLKEESEGGSSGSGGGQGLQNEYDSISVDAPSFFTGIDMINSTLARRLNFMHAEFLVISEDLAKSGMLREFIDSIIRFRQIRRSMHVFVSKCSAMELVEAAEPAVGTALSKNMQILVEESKITGFFPHVTLENFYEQMKSTYQQPAVMVQSLSSNKNFKTEGEKWEGGYKTGGEYHAGEIPISKQGKIEAFGTAVFDGDKMIDELTGDETRLMQIANGKFSMGSFTIPDPRNPSLIIPFDVRKAKEPKVTMKFDKDKPIINLEIKLEGDLLSVQSMIDYEQPELKYLAEKAFEKHIKDDLDRLILKCQKLKADIFGFGNFAARHFPTIQEWEGYSWFDKFQNADITTEINFTIRRTGTQLKSSPIVSTEEKPR